MEIKVNQIEKRSWVEVDLNQIARNYEIVKTTLPKNTEIMAVIKADAYGHGDAMVAKTLSALGVKLFAVSNIDEAVGLRNAGINGEILILGYSSPIYLRRHTCILKEVRIYPQQLSTTWRNRISCRKDIHKSLRKQHHRT